MLAYEEERFYTDKNMLKSDINITKTVEINGKKYFHDDIEYMFSNAKNILTLLENEEENVVLLRKREQIIKSTFMQFFCVEMFTTMLIILSLAS